jgi:hypothetical protein
VVLLVVKHLNAREMEASLAEHVVARVCLGRQDAPTPQMRDHSNIARASTALGQDGVDEVNAVILHVAKAAGLADVRLLSSETTVQEWPMGYPNEPGSLRGLAQRCGRALVQRKKSGGSGVDAALAPVEIILRSVKEHPRFAKGKPEKRQVLTRLLTEVGQLLGQTRLLLKRLGARHARGPHNAITTLTTMHAVARRLVPQMVPWITTGGVAQGKIIHAGLPQARAIVRHKAGQKVELGVPYLRSRLGGG